MTRFDINSKHAYQSVPVITMPPTGGKFIDFAWQLRRKGMSLRCSLLELSSWCPVFKSSHCFSVEDQSPIDYTNGWQIFKGDAFIWRRWEATRIVATVMAASLHPVTKLLASHDSGPLFTKKTPSYGYRDPHYKPKTVWRPSQVYNGNP